MRIVCTYCPQGPIEITAEQAHAECPGCGRSFRLLTRRVRQGSWTTLPTSQYRYRLVTEEPAGGERGRAVIGQGGLPLEAGSLVTLVYRGPRLVGVADQKRGGWHPVDPPRPVSEDRAAFARYLAGALGVIVALESVRFAFALAGAPVSALAGAAIVAALLAAAPLILRAAREREEPPQDGDGS